MKVVHLAKRVVLKSYKKIFNAQKNRKKDEKMIIFESFNGRQCSDNPRAIYDYMKEHYPEYKLIWSADRRHLANFKDVPHVRKLGLRWMLHMNKAKYWVSNSRNPGWIEKSNKTTYIQTWHGTPLKKLALDMENVVMPGTNTEKYKRNFKKETAKWDYLIAPNQFSDDIFRRAFAFEGEMIKSGYPRNDYLIKNKENEEEKNKLKEKLRIPKEKKVILYAPTWRDDQYFKVGQYKFKLELDIARLKEKFGEEAVLILRTHYLVAENIDTSLFGDFVIDQSTAGDIKELYLISDMLITDYSSVFFDYSLLERPMLFFTYDLEKYREELRGFYFDFEKLAPGPVCETNDHLIKEIEKIFAGNYNIEDEKKKFIEEFSKWEKGDASKQIAEIIVKGEK